MVFAADDVGFGERVELLSWLLADADADGVAEVRGDGLVVGSVPPPHAVTPARTVIESVSAAKRLGVTPSGLFIPAE
jgi:hypothetical protein